MDLSTWLDEEPGRAAALARHLGVTQGAVHQYRTQGVPVKRMKAIRAFSRNKVTLDAMVPESPVIDPTKVDATKPNMEAA
jgi:DNA-binding transcriptional regulator YdaS (Cro superfamily)